VAFAAVPAPPVLKFVVISVLGVPACFTAGYTLTRVPVVRRVF
jgi:hypothetical protein